MSDSTARSQRVRALVDPIASDLDLDVYDIEQRGGTLRVTLDTPPGSPAGVTLDAAGARHPPDRRASSTTTTRCPASTRSRSRARASSASLRTAAHFQREIGKAVTVRLADVDRRAAPHRRRARRRRRPHRDDPRRRRRRVTEQVVEIAGSTGPAPCSSGARSPSPANQAATQIASRWRRQPQPSAPSSDDRRSRGKRLPQAAATES